MSDQSQSQQGSEEFNAYQKTRAMVAKSHEDGEEAYVCEHGETYIKWKLKEEQNRLTSNDEAIYNAALRAQSNDGQIYIRVGNLNGPPVKVLQAT